MICTNVKKKTALVVNLTIVFLFSLCDRKNIKNGEDAASLRTKPHLVLVVQSNTHTAQKLRKEYIQDKRSYFASTNDFGYKRQDNYENGRLILEQHAHFVFVGSCCSSNTVQ